MTRLDSGWRRSLIFSQPTRGRKKRIWVAAAGAMFNSPVSLIEPAGG